MKYLLDTDHISFLQRGVGPDFAMLSLRLSQHPKTDVALSVVSFHEQAIGGHAYLNRAKTLAEVIRGYALLNSILQSYLIASVLPFDTSAGAIFQSLESRKTGLKTMDLRIAAIALSRSLILVTRNNRDFGKVSGLAFEDWTV